MTDRTQAPELVQREEIRIPSAEIHRLKNGIPVYVIRSGAQEVIKVELLFSAGQTAADRALLSAAANDLMDEGTRNRTAAELAEGLDYFGAYLQTESGADWATVSLYTLNKFTGDTLPYLLDILTQPLYPEEELSIYRSQGKQRLSVSLNKVDVLARRAFIRSLYGDQHPYGRLTMPEDYDRLNSDTLQEFHRQHYLNGLKAVFIAGLPTEKTVENIISDLDASGLIAGAMTETNVELPSPSRQLVEKADALQSAIRIGRRMFNRSHPDYLTFTVLNTVLGGYFGSRLMTNIREDKGYTYGIGSGLVSNRTDGYFFISTEVGADVREGAINEIYSELKRLREEEVPDAELTLVKNYMLGAFQRSLDGAFTLSDRYKMLCTNGLDKSYLEEYPGKLLEISPAQLIKCAGLYLQEEDLSEVVAGR